MSVVGKVGYKTEVDNEGLKAGLVASEKDVKEFAKKTGKAVNRIAEMAKKSLVVAGAAIGGLVAKSTKSYAEFEQLSGGVKKIFDQVDYSKISKDAQGAYKTMNISAGEYMRQITGVGATFAQTMGDEKGYETAKLGMQSLADYASGTGKSIDELMGKYQAITRSTSSYLSIADQFAGILPQTTDGFLKQAQASGYLSDKYKKLTDVPVEKYQEALTSMVRDGVKNAGLLGNTFDESEKTVSGSFNAMKASWDNFVVALADPDADISASIDTLADSVGKFIDNVLPVAFESLGKIFGVLWEKAPILTIIAVALGGLAAAVWIVNAAQTAWKASTVAFAAAQQVLNMVIHASPIFLIVGIITAIVGALVWFFTCTEDGKKALASFGEFMGKVFKGVWETITKVFSGVVGFFGNIWDGVKKAFGDFAANFGSFVSGVFKGAVNGVLSFIEGFINGPINVINGFIDVINGAFGAVGVNLGKVGTVSLPRLASGGIVPARAGGQIIMAGEAGEDEWVVPESKMSSLIDKINKNDNYGGGATFNFTFNGIVGTKSELRQCAITFHEAYEEVKRARMVA